MKVKELVEMLQQQDPESEVVTSRLYGIADTSEYLDEVFEVCHLEVVDVVLSNGEKRDEATVIYFAP